MVASETGRRATPPAPQSRPSFAASAARLPSVPWPFPLPAVSGRDPECKAAASRTHAEEVLQLQMLLQRKARTRAEAGSRGQDGDERRERRRAGEERDCISWTRFPGQVSQVLWSANPHRMPCLRSCR